MVINWFSKHATILTSFTLIPASRRWNDANEVAASLAMNQTKVVKPLPPNPQTNSYSHLIYKINQTLVESRRVQLGGGGTHRVNETVLVREQQETRLCTAYTTFIYHTWYSTIETGYIMLCWETSRTATFTRTRNAAELSREHHNLQTKPISLCSHHSKWSHACFLKRKCLGYAPRHFKIITGGEDLLISQISS